MTVYFTISLPRAGKSTLAGKYVRFEADISSASNGDYKFTDRPYNYRRLNGKDNPRVVINEDAIMLSLTGKRFTHKANPMVHAISHCMLRAYVNEGYDVLFDETFTTWKSIEELLWISDAIPVWIFKPIFQIDHIMGGYDFCKDYTLLNENEWLEHLNLCLKRAQDTKQEDLIPVIKNRHAPQLLELARDWSKFEDLRAKINKERQ